MLIFMAANIADIVIALVAVSHLGFLVLEMFLWEKPIGLRVFRQSAERAAITRVLAANQGLYNGFLAAGLVWGLLPGAFDSEIKTFFLSCVIIAGVFGAATVSRRILWIQAVPAAIGLALVVWT
jgi:putative membrane protein